MKKLIVLLSTTLLFGCASQTNEPQKTSNEVKAGVSICTIQNPPNEDQVSLVVSRDKNNQLRSIRWVYTGIYLGSKQLQEDQPDLIYEPTWGKNTEMNNKIFNYYNLNNDVTTLNVAISNYNERTGKKLAPITVDQARMFTGYDFYYTVENQTLFYIAKFKRNYDIIERTLSKDYLDAIMIYDQAEAGFKIKGSDDLSAQKYIDTVHTYPTEFAQALGIDKQVDIKCSKFK